MKTFLVLAVFGALLFVADQARPTPKETSAQSSENPDGGSEKPAAKKPVGGAERTTEENRDKEKGVAGFPVKDLSNGDVYHKLCGIVKTFAKYADSTSAYRFFVSKDKTIMKIAGENPIGVMTKDGSGQSFHQIFIDQSGRIIAEEWDGKVIKDAH